MIKIIPAIDLIEGRCVRLSQGDFSARKTYAGDPVELARRYADCGVQRIHVVDLDGARSARPCNLATLERMATNLSCELEWGGGVGSDEAVRQVLDAGATHVIAGSVAALQPEVFCNWLSEFGSRVILGADVRSGLVAVRGWQESAGIGLESLVRRFIPFGLRECIVTDISRDGMLGGPATKLYVDLREQFPAVTFTVSGGVASMADIEALDALGLEKVIVGKAIYENRITLEEIGQWSRNA